jgi:DNA-directed RNA polymerase subunit RPC12/RpoP
MKNSVVRCRCGHQVLAKEVLRTDLYERSIGREYVYVKYRCQRCKRMGEAFVAENRWDWSMLEPDRTEMTDAERDRFLDTEAISAEDILDFHRHLSTLGRMPEIAEQEDVGPDPVAEAEVAICEISEAEAALAEVFAREAVDHIEPEVVAPVGETAAETAIVEATAVEATALEVPAAVVTLPEADILREAAPEAGVTPEVQAEAGGDTTSIEALKSETPKSDETVSGEAKADGTP